MFSITELHLGRACSHLTFLSEGEAGRRMIADSLTGEGVQELAGNSDDYIPIQEAAAFDVLVGSHDEFLLAQGLQLTAATLNKLANFLVHLSPRDSARDLEPPVGCLG